MKEKTQMTQEHVLKSISEHADQRIPDVCKNEPGINNISKLVAQHLVESNDFSIRYLAPGRSGAIVLLITYPRDTPTVIKIGTSELIQKEVDNFRKTRVATRINPGINQEAGELSCQGYRSIAYTWAGGHSEVRSFKEFFLTESTDKVRNVIQPLMKKIENWHSCIKSSTPVFDLWQWVPKAATSELLTIIGSSNLDQSERDRIVSAINSNHTKLRDKFLTRSYTSATCHGDLNVYNIVINADSFEPNIIDFASVRTSDSPARDWAKLEREIKYRCLVDSCQERDFIQGLEDIDLSCATHNINNISSSAAKAGKVIYTIRKQYHEIANSFTNNPDIEYLYFLFCWTLAYLISHEGKAAKSYIKEGAIISASRILTQLYDYHEISDWSEKPMFEFEKKKIDKKESIIDKFSYEKDIIKLYTEERKSNVKTFNEAVNHGLPFHWPSVKDLSEDADRELEKNPLVEQNIGHYRDRQKKVLAAALTEYKTWENKLTFLEAGPRKGLLYPEKKHGDIVVGIVVAGGIAPGINAVVDGIVQRHWQYAHPPTRPGHHSIQIRGYKNGLHGLTQHNPDYYTLIPNNEVSNDMQMGKTLVTSNHANHAGSALGTKRWDELLNTSTEEREKLIADKICTNLNNVDILYVIGGDGSMKLAHAISELSGKQGGRRSPLSVVAVPKTTDNDILWTWQSFGFPTAAERAREVIDQLDTEVKSNPRLCIAQLFGSDSGFVVSHAVLASAAGQCDIALIPEVNFSLIGLARFLEDVIISTKRVIPHGLIVMAETAVPVDAKWYIERSEKLPDTIPKNDKEIIEHIRSKSFDLSESEKKALLSFDNFRNDKKRTFGQTSDDLRRAGLKIVKQGLERYLTRSSLPGQIEWSKLRLVLNEPRHLLRTAPPSTTDIVNAQRLGILAVDNAMAGYTDFMVGQWLTEFVLVPLELVVLGRKRIPEDGMFWKQILAKTGQPADLISPWPKLG